MEIRHSINPEDARHYDTEKLRREFLIQKLFKPSEITLVYTNFDRIILGGVVPVKEPIRLETDINIGTDYFLERREAGIINIGGKGKIAADDTEYTLDTKDCLYAGTGTKKVVFSSEDKADPARFYLNCAPAHKSFPTKKIGIAQAEPIHLGAPSESNKRTIYKYIHPEGVKSCQLVMGLTELEPNNIWNTMPCHTHIRRMEVYLYFNVAEDAVVFHLIGQPEETRHIVVRNEEAVISPYWSIHSGVGTRNYSFIWGMVGENQTFTDMDSVPMDILK
ncbi:MAG: 5-dehydro-4-deoxy-D-glucuronate isomerase [Spirochaetes bacterium]|nr:5-dehydro-4-deoxy-D-glucuronate isomerase [Spirochaetota bacterium]